MFTNGVNLDVSIMLVRMLKIVKLFVEDVVRKKLDRNCEVAVFIPLYEPLEVSKCKKCDNIAAQPKELVRIQKSRNLFR